MVDEWPAFAAQQDTISHILSQCRKFNLRLYLAAQSLAQVDTDRLVGALENCKLQIAFGLGRDSAETQAKHIGIIDPMMIKEEQFFDTQHNQFSPLQEQWESWIYELQNLKPREAYVKLEGKSAVKIQTIHVPESKYIPDELEEVLATYRSTYQRTQEDAAARMTSMPTVTSQPAYKKLFAKA